VKRRNHRNWDWKSAASDSLISLDILAHAPTKRPRIKMMTEAGVIGKIGVNSHGISVMLNALKVNFPFPYSVSLSFYTDAMFIVDGLEEPFLYPHPPLTPTPPPTANFRMLPNPARLTCHLLSLCLGSSYPSHLSNLHHLARDPPNGSLHSIPQRQ